MGSTRHRINLIGLAAAACSAAAPFAHAQETPAPTPAPSRTPSVIYLPGVVPERFDLGPPRAAPAPTPAPTPAATPAPTPRPAATAAPRPLATTAPRAASPQTPAPAIVATPAPAPQPVPDGQPTAAPSAEPAATPTPAPVAVPESASTPAWLWMLLGGGATALLIGAFWALRRRRVHDEVEEAEAPAVLVEPAPRPASSAPAPRASGPLAKPPVRPAAPPPPLAPAQADPFELALRPVRVEIGEQEVAIELELLIGNLQPAPADAVRLQFAVMTASPDQDRHIAGFHASPMIDSSGPPFDLAAGAGGRMPVRLRLAREQVHVVEVGGRPLFVPMVMLDIRWRAGISIRRFGADFMLGTAGQGGKLGPIWLDRPQPTGPLAATRYFPRQAAAA